MPSGKDWKAAFAICASLVGAGFASGRDITSLFCGMGRASWLCITAVSAASALLVYALMRLSCRTGESVFPRLFKAPVGQACRDALTLLHALLYLCAAASMLSAGAGLGALTFPVRHSHALGLILTCCAALCIMSGGLRSLSGLGIFFIVLSVLCFGTLSRTANAGAPIPAEGLLLPIPAGLLYASLRISIAGGTICLYAADGASPVGTARLCGLLMLILLSCANAALLTGSEEIRHAALPAVLLTARWGIWGYYCAIALIWTAALNMLCSMLQSLCALLKDCRLSRPAALSLSLSAACVLCVCASDLVINIFYPFLRWIALLSLLGLLLFQPVSEEPSE